MNKPKKLEEHYPLKAGDFYVATEFSDGGKDVVYVVKKLRDDMTPELRYHQEDGQFTVYCSTNY